MGITRISAKKSKFFPSLSEKNREIIVENAYNIDNDHASCWCQGTQIAYDAFDSKSCNAPTIVHIAHALLGFVLIRHRL